MYVSITTGTETGTAPRFKLIDPNHAWKRFNHEKKTLVLNHDLFCLGSTYINQISGFHLVRLKLNYVHISISVSSSEKELYYKSMMWHSICEFFGRLFFFQKFSKQWDFKNFKEVKNF